MSILLVVLVVVVVVAALAVTVEIRDRRRSPAEHAAHRGRRIHPRSHPDGVGVLEMGGFDGGGFDGGGGGSV